MLAWCENVNIGWGWEGPGVREWVGGHRPGMEGWVGMVPAYIPNCQRAALGGALEFNELN